MGDWTGALARLFREREAIFDVTSGRRVSYSALAGRVDTAAAALARLGVTRGDRVCVLAKNRLEHLDVMFACARLGALFVPMNWRLAEPELRFVIDDTEARVLLVDDADVGARLVDGTPTSSLSLDARWAALLEEARDDEPVAQAAVGLDDAWIVLYTSGTTGRPKGALLPFRQVAFNALNTSAALDLRADDRTVTYTPLFHTGALHVLTTPLLAKGGSIVLCDGFDAGEILRLNAEEHCTLLFGVPTTFELMAQAPGFDDADLSAVRVALCGGAPCPLSLIERYAARGVVFKQGYGLTEVGPNVLNLNAEDVITHAGSAGQPNLTIAAKLLDEDGAEVVGAGRGELVLGGPCVCLGYWRRDDATRDAFTADGFFRTGDVVERDEAGFHKIVDRKKDMFISGGENVYPAEVEKALADHPSVGACAVVGVKDARWGEVGRAYLEARGDVDVDDLRGWLKNRLASYKVPKEFVPVDALPRNASGKVQKHLLGGEAS